jgi:dCTP deaminase
MSSPSPVGKSTYARCGIITNVTPFEPEWEGFVTLEISNTTPLPAKIYANEGIAQVLFFKGSEPPEVSYRDKQGKYQGPDRRDAAKALAAWIVRPRE